MDGICIGMWSGPRNISTAMMRAWENRADTRVVDEPLYAHYLATTGIDHPGRDDILAAQSQDWRTVARELTRDPGAGRVFYQKHMTHHMTPDVDLGWIDALANCFLIRDPDEVVASYTAVRTGADPEDLGYVQQRRIFDHVANTTGTTPPILDAKDVLEDPDGMLRAVCARLELDFDPAMLSWPAGRRDSDGVWAPHWYAAVDASTGFAPRRKKHRPLDDAQRAVSDACRPHYEALHALRLTV